MRRRHLVLLHRYVGLTLGAWFVLLGLTGSALVYQHEIDQWLNPSLLRDSGSGESIGIAAVLERAQSQFPSAAVERLRIPQAEGEVYRLLIREQRGRRVGSPRLEATFSPTSGKLLGTRPVEVYGIAPELLVRTIYDLHHKVLLGNNGKTAVGVIGLALLTTLFFGLFLATANARRLRFGGLVGVRISAGAARVLYDIHRSIGLTVAILLLISAVTGLTLVFPDYARELVGLFSRVAPFPTVPFARMDEQPDRSMSSAHWARVRSAYPRARITEIHFPSRPASGQLLYLRSEDNAHRLGDTLVWLDSRTGEILMERSDRSRTSGEQLLHWLLPLHSGVVFGATGKAMMCIAGLAPLLLALTGVLLWLWKRRSARFERSRRVMLRRTSPHEERNI